MKKFIALTVALTLLGSSAAIAQYNGNNNRGAQQAQNRYDNNNRNDRNDNDRRDNDRRDNDRRDGRNEVRDRPHWSRGDRLPRDYRERRYEVSDWRARHLRQPPRGYHWVQVDDRYALAAITTGLIAEIILNSGR